MNQSNKLSSKILNNWLTKNDKQSFHHNGCHAIDNNDTPEVNQEGKLGAASKALNDQL